MPDYTRFPQNRSILREVKIESDTAGKEAAAEIFGKIGKQVTQTLTEINNEKSNASLYQATNQMYRLKQVTEQEMMENPEQISMLLDTTKQTANNILNNVPMNSADRKRLEYLSKNDITDIEMKGLRISSQFAKTQGTINFSMQFPEKLQQIEDSIGDEKAFEINTLNAQKMISDAVKGGFINIKQSQTYTKSLHSTLEKVRIAHEIAMDESKHTAENLHRVAARTHKTNNFHQVGLPTDENNRSLVYERQNQFNAEDITASMINGQLPNLMVVSNLSPHKQEEIKIQYDAKNELDAKINSGISYEELKHVRNDLNEPNKVLNTKERFQKVYLDNYFRKFEQDQFLREMGNYGEGARLSHENNMKVKAFMNDKSLNKEQKESMIKEFNNQYVSGMVAVGLSHGIPQSQIKPIHSSEIMKVKNAFNAGSDPMDVLRTVDYYNDRNKVYVSGQLDNPIQKEVVYHVGNLVGHTSNEMRADLVIANQKGIDFKPLQIGKEGISDSKIKFEIQSDPNIEKINDYNRHFKDGQSRTASMIDMTTNVVKYESMKDQDYEMIKYSKHVKNWGKEYSKGYDIKKGSYYQFNKKQQPQLNDHEWELIADHAREEAYENMHKDSRYSHADFLQSIDQNPLYVTITPDNFIVTMDQGGNVLYSHYFTNDLVNYANKQKNKRLEEESKKAENVSSFSKGYF